MTTYKEKLNHIYNEYRDCIHQVAFTHQDTNQVTQAIINPDNSIANDLSQVDEVLFVVLNQKCAETLMNSIIKVEQEYKIIRFAEEFETSEGITIAWLLQ